MKDQESTGYRAVRAQHTATSITVYQAYSAEIADAALAAGTFAPPFKRERMTWIKPSFRWMAYRCGWATKPGQERVLAVEITREGFEWALEHAGLSHFEPDTHGTREQWAEQQRASPVRVQWDPERDLRLRPLGHRSIQIGLGGEAVHRYVDDWITGIADVTPVMRGVAELVAAGDLEAARAGLPQEEPYPLPDRITRRLGATG
ncbi:protein of unknown function [Saccharopolyspora kobensis]|uniref:DUF4291 domain-containing protein n=1 Tax=Saccharopolyspora kobensis TaxID=146035 RepID=A0A1H6BTL8_9PSEU|nr:DUF4291 domain-containing protein [Saccharopolyspora kobensis]SEG64019.1 protein of unknown function [Saccharopolyspora kobensis]SFC15567.1 protein of unknown function [Saccharopolyspora kobensis]